MNKELEALEKILNKFVEILLETKCEKPTVANITYLTNSLRVAFRNELGIIETALKRLAVYETFDLLDEKDEVDKLTDIKGKLTYVDKVMDTQERLLASVSADEIRILSSVLNSQIKILKKKLKALEILIKKNVKIDVLKYQSDVVFYNMAVFEKEEKLTQEEYDLLKKVLKDE